MKLLKAETIIQYSVEEVKCNCCGKTIEKDSFGNTFDFLSVYKRWGYGTSIDNQEHEFDLCEDCYKKIISQFKIPVVKK